LTDELESSVDLGDHDTTTFQWPKVNVAAGTKVMISILDDKDEEGWSGPVSRKNVSLLTYSLMFSF